MTTPTWAQDNPAAYQQYQAAHDRLSRYLRSCAGTPEIIINASAALAQAYEAGRRAGSEAK